MLDQLGLAVALLVTLGLYSMPLWKDNLWFRIAEAMYVGVSLGNVTVVAVNLLINRAITPVTTGTWITIIPILLSIIFYMRFIPQYRWISRWPLAIVTAIGASMLLRSGIVSTIKLTGGSFVNRFLIAGTSPLNTLDAILCFVVAFSSTIYFIYTIKRDNPALVGIRNLGKFFLIWYYGSQLAGSFLGYMGRGVARWAFILETLGLA